METIQEVADTEEDASVSTSGTRVEDAALEEVKQEEESADTEETLEIPSLEEETAKELWQEVQKHKENEKEIDTSAPISIVGQTDYMGMDKLSLTTEELRGETDGDNKANTLATLPPYLGDYETKIEVIHIPESQQITPGVKDTANLQAILSAPVTTTLPLADFLKVKPKLWEYVAEMMRK